LKEAMKYEAIIRVDEIQYFTFSAAVGMSVGRWSERRSSSWLTDWLTDGPTDRLTDRPNQQLHGADPLERPPVVQLLRKLPEFYPILFL
jgi:hypothetical protein